MKATYMYGPGDVRVEETAWPEITAPTDAVIKIVLSCVCGSDLWDYYESEKTETGRARGHEFLGVVDKIGSDVTKFKVGDQVQIRDLPDLFYSRTMAYTRGAIGTVVRLVYESPPAEDEAWDNTDRPVWFYSVVFKQQDLWPEYSAAYPNDTVETEFPETYLASA